VMAPNAASRAAAIQATRLVESMMISFTGG